MPNSESDHVPVRSQRWGVAAIVVGLVLACLSFLPAFSGGSERWTSDEARAYQDASMKIQNLTHQLGSEQPETVSRNSSADFEKAIEDFQELRSKLEEARDRSGLWGTTLRLAGVALLFVGAARLWSARRSKA